MTQRSNPTSLPTDTYATTPAASPTRPGLSINQKRILGISAAAVLLGGAMGLVLGGDKGTKPGSGAAPSPTDGTSSTGTAHLPDDIDVAGKVSDSMSFDHAFSTARDEVGMGGVFSWHGHWYNTFEKDEWTSLSLEQRQHYAEQITGEKLPVKPYSPPSAHTATATTPGPQAEPTVIEGYIHGQRVMGLDFDQDGIIDTVVMDGPDGQTYRVVDATGDEGLDTMYRYDSLDGAVTAAIVLDYPFVLSNDDFRQGLESTMSKEVVDSILYADPTPVMESVNDGADDLDADDDIIDDDHYGSDADELNDTYVNDGDVHDMDE